MPFKTLSITDQPAIRTITIQRPEKLNALDRATIVELRQAFADVASSTEIRVVVLTGAGPQAFVAGAAIAELAALSAPQALEFSRYGQSLMTTIERLGKPVIAKINGFALGGGLELAMACHLRIAADSAKLGQPEINLGVMPGFGGTQRLVRLAGRSAALELCLLGAPITAARALALGIVNRVVAAEQLDAEVAALASQLAAAAPHAQNGILQAIVLGSEAAIEIGLDYEAQAFAVTAATDDKREGTSAFLERRKPVFVGR